MPPKPMPEPPALTEDEREAIYRRAPARTAEITSVSPIHAAYTPACITGPGGGLSGPIDFGCAFGKSRKKRTATKTSEVPSVIMPPKLPTTVTRLANSELKPRAVVKQVQKIAGPMWISVLRNASCGSWAVRSSRKRMVT